MSKEEISKWLLNQIIYCYPVINKSFPQYTFYFYDEKFIRKIKMCKLLNEKLTPPNKVNGKCIYSINKNTNTILLHYEDIWKFFEKNYINDYNKIQIIISSIINNYKQLNKFTPKCNSKGFRYPELIRCKEDMIIYNIDWSSILPDSVKHLTILSGY